MATKIIRYSNHYAFDVESVDFSTDEVVVEDHVVANPTKVYCVLDEHNSYASRHELSSKRISEGRYHEFLMYAPNPTYYRISADEKAKLLSEGVCTAFEEYGRSGRAKVFVGLKIVPFLEEKGAKSLAKCYEEIAKKRKQHSDHQAEIDTLLAIGANAAKEEETSENIVEDIKWFLDNRKEIKAKCK